MTVPRFPWVQAQPQTQSYHHVGVVTWPEHLLCNYYHGLFKGCHYGVGLILLRHPGTPTTRVV